jgi:hypothetical protein
MQSWVELRTSRSFSCRDWALILLLSPNYSWLCLLVSKQNIGNLQRRSAVITVHFHRMMSVLQRWACATWYSYGAMYLVQNKAGVLLSWLEYVGILVWPLTWSLKVPWDTSWKEQTPKMTKIDQTIHFLVLRASMYLAIAASGGAPSLASERPAQRQSYTRALRAQREHFAK